MNFKEEIILTFSLLLCDCSTRPTHLVNLCVYICIYIWFIAGGPNSGGVLYLFLKAVQTSITLKIFFFFFLSEFVQSYLKCWQSSPSLSAAQWLQSDVAAIHWAVTQDCLHDDCSLQRRALKPDLVRGWQVSVESRAPSCCLHNKLNYCYFRSQPFKLVWQESEIQLISISAGCGDVNAGRLRENA